MEEPGMESGIQGRGGLLTMRRLSRSIVPCMLSLLLPLGAAAESGSAEALELIVSTRPERPAADSSMVISILVNHPRPAEVVVSVPDLPASVGLERYSTLSRSVEGPSGDEEHWSAVELSLFLRFPGEALIPPIGISVPGKAARTEAMELLIAGKLSAPPQAPTLAWRGVPDRAVAGKPLTAGLVGTDFGNPAELESVVAVQENALVQSLERGDSGAVLRFRITPLAAGSVELPSVLVRSGNAEVRSPSRSVRVAAAPSGQAPAQAPAMAPAQAPASASAAETGGARVPGARPLRKAEPVDFDAFPLGTAPAFLAREQAARLDPARTAWRSGDGAYSLALLRAGERDSPAGFLLSGTRRAAESALGIDRAADERFAPPVILIPLSIVSLSAALSALLARRRGRRRWTGAAVLIALPLFLLSSTYALWSRIDSKGFLGSGARVVLRSCFSYRVPYERSGPVDEFSSGWTARVLSVADSWAYIETADGRAGWIDRSKLLFY